MTKPISRRISLARAQDWKCHYCTGQMVTRTGRSDTATVDHKIPLARGGTWHFSNLAGCCWRCNHVKGSLTEEEFRLRYPDMSLLPYAAPGSASAPYAAKTRRQRREEQAKIISDRLRNVAYDPKYSATASLADFAPHLQRAIPWEVRLERAWDALWEHCLETVDRRRAAA